MREYQELNAKRRERVPAPLWVFWAPDAEKFYRWRVQLDCGCIKEVLTTGEDELPSQGQWRDLIHGERLPAGQMLCLHDDAPPAPSVTSANGATARRSHSPPIPSSHSTG